MELRFHFCPLSVPIKGGGEVLFYPMGPNVKSSRWKQQQNNYHSKRVSVKCVRSDGVAENSRKVMCTREDTMLEALEEKRTEDAWKMLEQSIELPSSLCLSRLVAQLSCEKSTSAFHRAETVVKRLQNEGKLHLLDSKSLGLLATAAVKCKVPQYGAEIIRLMLKLDLLPHVEAWSAVVRQLGNCPDDFESAIDLFNEVCKRIREKNEGLNDEVPKICMPDRRAFKAILKACQIGGNVEMAHTLICEMDLFGVELNAPICNAMIRVCAKAERKDLLVGVLEKMLRENIGLSRSTFHSLVGAYVGLGDLEMAKRLIEAMSEGRRDICSVMREPIASSGSLEVGTKEELASDCHEDVSGETLLLPTSFKPDAKVCTLLMREFMQLRRWDDVVRMLKVMQTNDDSQSLPGEVTYATAISAFVSMGSMDKARNVIDEMSANGVPVQMISYNTLLCGYCKSLDIQKAEILFKDMEEAGISPDSMTYDTLICGYIRVDDFVGALSYFNRMKEAGMTPSIFTSTALVRASAMNSQLNLAAQLFDAMLKDRRVKVDMIPWDILIQCYCKAGRIEDAKKVFVQMKEHNLHPNVTTYTNLIDGFAKARKPGEVLVLWKEIRARIMARGGESKIKPLRSGKAKFLLDPLLYIFVKAAFFGGALEVIACMEYLRIPANKIKYKRIFLRRYSWVYQIEQAEQTRELEAFKFWVGVPNNYCENEWKKERRNGNSIYNSS